MIENEELTARRTLIATDVSARLKEVYDFVGGVKELSGRTGIPIRTLHNYTAKGGKQTEPKVGDLTLIAKIANVSMDWLVGRSDEFLFADPETDIEIARTGTKSGYSLIPRYDVHASAGPGLISISEEITDHLAFRQDWLSDLGVDPQYAALVKAVGDSMSPTIPDGSVLLVDLNIDKVRDGCVYVIVLDGDLLVKRIRRRINGDVELVSDNGDVPTEVISNSELDNLDIAGRVRWIGHAM